MTNQTKRRRLSTPNPTIATTTEKRTLLYNTRSKTHSSGKGKRKTRNTFSQPNSDNVADVYPNLADDIEEIKRYASEILHHERSTVELRSDGSIVITPHPRQLPNEIVSLIINHLPRHPQEGLYECALVSKQFHDIANPLIWQLLKFDVDSISPAHFLECISYIPSQRLAILGHHICELCLDDHHWTDAQLLRLIPHLPHLKHLSIDEGTQITDTSFRDLPYHCQHLTSLKLGATPLTRLSFAAIGRYCQQLRALDWVITNDQLPEWLDLLKKCPLERLRITSHYGTLDDKVLATIQSFDQLTCLEIYDTSPSHMPLRPLRPPTMRPLRPPTVPPPTTTARMIFSKLPSPRSTTRAAATTITPWWPPLTKLTLHPCYDIDDTMMMRFIKTVPGLEKLDLEQPTHLTDATLDAMAVGLPKLTHATMILNDNMTPDGVRRWIHKSPHLEYVMLYGGRRLRPMDFPELKNSSNWCDLELYPWGINKIRQSARRNANNNNN